MRFAVRITWLVVLCLFVLALTPISIDAANETHVVQPGDTLYAIALRYNTTVAAIKQLNKLDSDLIIVGQVLRIPDNPAPTLSASSYIVQTGDSLYTIALRYGTTMRALQQLNDLPNPNLIFAGQSLAIPNSASVAKPGLIIEPAAARQGGTLLIKVARSDASAITGTFNGKKLTFTRAAGYWYALAGVSRCAKIGTVPLSITVTNFAGQSTTESANVNIGTTAFVVQSITLPPAVSGILSNAELVNREAAQLAAIVGRYTPTRLWSGAWRQPVYGTITSTFGTRRSYNGGTVGACGHEGTDFNTAGGLAVSAPARGKVVFAGLTQVRGNLVVIDHGVGVFSAYYHLAEIDVTVDQIVPPGTLIGKIGSTGLSTGPHLHWSTWVNGEYVDPMEWTRRVMP